MFKSIKDVFKTYFVTGLIVLGPLFISIWILKAIVTGADETIQAQHWIGVDIPGLGILVALVIILIAGFLGKNVLGRLVFVGTTELLRKIPIIGPLYTSTQQVFDTLLGGQAKQFGRVVLIQYPIESTWAPAFVTNETVPQEVQGLFSQKMLSVYVPTTPNPTSGFYLYVPVEKTKETDLSVEDALKLIISMGLIRHEGRGS